MLVPSKSVRFGPLAKKAFKGIYGQTVTVRVKPSLPVWKAPGQARSLLTAGVVRPAGEQTAEAAVSSPDPSRSDDGRGWRGCRGEPPGSASAEGPARAVVTDGRPSESQNLL